MNNCSCLDKAEDHFWEEDLGCWYVTRECEDCGYYWEGPIAEYDDPEQYGVTSY